MTNPYLPADRQDADEVPHQSENHCLNEVTCTYSYCECDCDDCQDAEMEDMYV